jgi:PAS domain S-box-containing protein
VGRDSGHPIKESLGHSIAEFIDEEDREAALASIIVREGRPAREPRELRFHHQSGDVVWLELSARTFEEGIDELSAVERIVGSLYNINDRKHAREELQKAHDQLEVRVEERTTALQETNQRLREEIAEREQVEEAPRHAKEAAEAATNASPNF